MAEWRLAAGVALGAGAASSARLRDGAQDVGEDVRLERQAPADGPPEVATVHVHPQPGPMVIRLGDYVSCPSWGIERAQVVGLTMNSPARQTADLMVESDEVARVMHGILVTDLQPL